MGLAHRTPPILRSALRSGRSSARGARALERPHEPRAPHIVSGPLEYCGRCASWPQGAGARLTLPRAVQIRTSAIATTAIAHMDCNGFCPPLPLARSRLYLEKKKKEKNPKDPIQVLSNGMRAHHSCSVRLNKFGHKQEWCKKVIGQKRGLSLA